MVNEKRFIVESVSIIDDCNEDKSRIAKVITDTDETYSYEDLYEVADLLNEQQADLNYLAKFIGEFKVEKFKLKLRNLRMLEDKVLKQQDLLNEQQEKITELEIELTDCKNRKEQLEYKNTKLIAKIDFLERVIDGDV